MQFLLAYSATQVAHKSVQSLLVLRPCINLRNRAAQVSHYASRSQGNTACKQSLLRSRYCRFTAEIKLNHVYQEIKCETNIKKISSLTKILTNIRSIRVLKISELYEC